ncbi:MAG: hypothetical protein P8X87_02835 [Candidatus Bathyarchaeota archaeon]
MAIPSFKDLSISQLKNVVYVQFLIIAQAFFRIDQKLVQIIYLQDIVIRKISIVRFVVPVCSSAFSLDFFLESSKVSDVIFSIISFAVIFAILAVVMYISGNIVVGEKEQLYKAPLQFRFSELCS